MNKKEWDELQKEFNLKIYDANYKNLTKEKARKLFTKLVNNFNDIYNGEEKHNV